VGRTNAQAAAAQEEAGNVDNSGLRGDFVPGAPPEIANLPTPRLPDGTPDISGP
jgi:hypothetical protein